MEKYYAILSKCPLFAHINPDEFPHLLKCLDITIGTYSDNEYVFTLGTQVNTVAIILEGQAEILKENAAGLRNIVTLLGPGNLFGEGVVCSSRRISPVSIYIKESATIMFIPYEKIVESCHNSCGFHIQLIKNMLHILGDKNLVLNQKMDLLMLKGMRAKLACYLLQEAQRQDRLSFNIPLSREQLADFLNVSRPSMSRELARMKDEGLIDYYRNSFKIYDLAKLSEVAY